MKLCPTCKTQYPEDANFCPQESCATAEGPQRLHSVAAQSASRFQPIEKLGGGRTGEVWRARDKQTGVEVAYKTVTSAVLATPALLARAEREFKQLMRVASPKVATIVDCEKTAGGGLAVAMELWRGDSLEHILASGPVTFDQAKSIVLQVGQALLEAQKAGLVHRDVAPKNVLVSASGDVKVINFPLAVPVNDKISGVADYLSPEQVQGKPVDQRSNTYSLAAILYHLFTGEPPFHGATTQAVLDMHVSSPVLPPTQRRPTANLPADTDKLILKALDKSSSRRHLTLRLFLNELEALKGQSVGAAKPVGGAGLAKTMMFGGNQAEIAKMVAEARAAKAAERSMSPASGVASPVAAAARPSEAGQTIAPGAMAVAGASKVPAQPAPAPARTRVPTPHATGLAAHAPTPDPYTKTPAPVSVGQPAHVAPTVVVPTPTAKAPAQPAAMQPAEAGKAPPPKAGAAFRETLWFKKGDVEQMVADAKAKLQAAGTKRTDSAELGEDARPLEDRYVDDGSVTVEDRKKFSLRTGGTATALPSVAVSVPGQKMDERELVGEIGGGRRTLILVIAAAVILALVVVVVMMVQGKGKGSAATSTATMTASQAAPQAAQPFAAATPDADVAAGTGTAASPATAGAGAPPGRTGGALGSTGGSTKPGVGGATGDAKPTAAQVKKQAKKKPVVKRPKHKR
jgi:serine/threonine-protein kinase